MDIKAALSKAVDQLDLSTEEMQDVMRQIMTGQCTDAQVGGLFLPLPRWLLRRLEARLPSTAIVRSLVRAVVLICSRRQASIWILHPIK